MFDFARQAGAPPPGPSRFPKPYSRTKAEAERIVRIQSGNGFEVTIVR